MHAARVRAPTMSAVVRPRKSPGWKPSRSSQRPKMSTQRWSRSRRNTTSSIDSTSVRKRSSAAWIAASEAVRSASSTWLDANAAARSSAAESRPADQPDGVHVEVVERRAAGRDQMATTACTPCCALRSGTRMAERAPSVSMAARSARSIGGQVVAPDQLAGGVAPAHQTGALGDPEPDLLAAGAARLAQHQRPRRRARRRPAAAAQVSACSRSATTRITAAEIGPGGRHGLLGLDHRGQPLGLAGEDPLGLAPAGHVPDAGDDPVRRSA